MTNQPSKGFFFLAPGKDREGFTPREPNKTAPKAPDWEHWRKPENRVVSLRKAVQLSLNVDLGEGEFSSDVEERYKLALLHVENWVGKPVRVSNAKVISRRFLGPGQNVTLAEVDLFHFAAWCLTEKLEVPDGFASLASKPTGKAVRRQAEETVQKRREKDLGDWLKKGGKNYLTDGKLTITKLQAWGKLEKLSSNFSSSASKSTVDHFFKKQVVIRFKQGRRD